jgi:magnesium chelatase family protein
VPKGYATVFAAQPMGAGAELVTIETDLSQGLHAFSIVGLPDKAIEESRDRISAAIRHSGFKSPKATNRRIILSLSPANLRKEGSQYDLPLAICYLAAAGDIVLPVTPMLFAGELGLNGTLRATRGILAQVLAAKKAGIKVVVVAPQNAQEAFLPGDVTVYAPQNLEELVAHLQGITILEPYTKKQERGPAPSVLDIGTIRGQETAKRALEIAATGRLNLMLYGPPGTGKTMLARAVCGILPPLSFSEMIEVTALHSTAGILSDGSVVEWAPFRSPHHTASATALIGGGSFPRAGEVTLAHRGILFLDEFPEFDTRSIESLRQPLEDKFVTIARTKGSLTFPADCMIIAAMNPAETLTTQPEVAVRTALKQARKLSRAIVDRIDMWVEVPHLSQEELYAESTGETSEVVRERVTAARAIGTASRIEPLISEDAKRLLMSAVGRLALSPRAYHRTLRVSGSIAHLRGSNKTEPQDVLEALQYRPRGLFGFE